VWHAPRQKKGRKKKKKKRLHPHWHSQPQPHSPTIVMSQIPMDLVNTITREYSLPPGVENTFAFKQLLFETRLPINMFGSD
jgi:hypothetical protein